MQWTNVRNKYGISSMVESRESRNNCFQVGFKCCVPQDRDVTLQLLEPVDENLGPAAFEE